ncbi:MAG: NAD(P)/FAD-dependent oxidoreductase [Deltaproteobacteria bacterium]|nr:NAD(P)/FAD-dependent oxidoreductase [Deltaproteobacteria bacterium]
MEKFDVAVVGAGPAGSSAAIALARKGYSVALLDKAFFPREKLCGDFLNPINNPVLGQLGVAKEIRQVPSAEVTAFRVTEYRGSETVVPLPSPDGAQRVGLGLRRLYLDDILVTRAAKEGALLRLGCKIQAIRREKERWSITAGAAKERLLLADFLIGADGRNSAVAHWLGLSRPGERTGSHIGFQLHLRGVREIVGEVQIHLFPGGYAGLVRIGEGLVNLCFSLERKRAQNTSVEALFRECLFTNPYLRSKLASAEPVGKLRSVYPVYFSPRRCFGDGFLLAGDAARVTEPVTGEGVYFALKSGELAAEMADQAFKKMDFSARQLSSYEKGCRRAFGKREKINRIIRAFIYHPALLRPLIRISSETSFPIVPLVHSVCGK